MTGQRPHDVNNFAPRTGFAYQVNDRTVIRGGYGLFFTQLEADAAHQSQLQIEHVVADGAQRRAGRLRGESVQRAGADVRAGAGDGVRHQTATGPGCLRRSVANEIPFGDHDTSFSHMASLGVQRQFGAGDGGRVELRVHRRPQGRVRAEHQPDVQPGDGREPAVPGHGADAVPGLGHGAGGDHDEAVELPRVGEQLHQAVREPVAGERDLYAGVVPGRGAESVHRRAGPDGRRFRRS